MSWIACALAFGLYYVVKRYLPRRLSRTPGVSFVPFALLAIGTVTLADTVVGVWASTYLIEPVLGFLGGFVGVSAALLAGVAFVLLTVAAVFDLIDLNPEGIAKTAVLVLPFLALVAVGPFAAAGSGLFDAVANTGAGALTNLVGQ